MSDKALKNLRKTLKNQRKEAWDAALGLAGASSTDGALESDFEFAMNRVDELDKRLEKLPKVQRIREPDIYERKGPHSFFRDILATVSPVPVPGTDTANAQARLARHNALEAERRQSSRDVRAIEARALGISWQDQGIQTRALSSGSGVGGEFLPPKWLVDCFASVARAASPLRRLVRSIPLPDGCLELVIPRVTAVSGVVGPDASENTAPASTVSATDSITGAVRTFAGELEVSQQLYDRGGSFADQLVVSDFAESYAASLEQQLVNGTGTSGQLLGLLSVPSSVATTYTSASPTTAGVIEAVANLAAAVSDARERPPSFVLMRPSRYFWLAGMPDGSGNVSTQRLGTGVKGAKAPDDGPFGPLGGMPVYLDATLPADLGAGTNQDVVIAVRGQDVILLEDVPRFSAIVDAQGAAENLSVYLRYHVYVACFTSRYPSGIGSVTGTGFVVPAGW